MQSGITKVLQWLWAVVWLTLPVSMRANAFFLILFGIVAVIHAIIHKPAFQKQQLLLAGLFILFFLWQGASLLFDPFEQEVLKSLERKLSLLAIPVIMILVNGSSWNTGKWAMRGFFTGLLLTGIHMLTLALINLFTGQPLESFTYHQFTAPYGISAIYYSCFLAVAIYMLVLQETEKMIRKFRLFLVVFFIILLLFCASKLFIALTIPAVFWPVVKIYYREKGIKRYILPLILVVIFGIASVPFAKRISELKNTDLDIVTRESYSYDTPINGLTFRLILWRFAGEIMHDENAWLTGTGIGNRQHVLDSYYTNYRMYVGNPDLGDKGYLGYNFHNQYLEVMVGSGIPGLLILFSIIIFIFFIERSKLFFPLVVYIVIMLFLLTESMLERQAGLVFFCLLWNMRVHNPQS